MTTFPQTTTFHIVYADDMTPLNTYPELTQKNAATLEAALLQGGIVPPGAADLAIVGARVTALEADPVGDLTLGDASFNTQIVLGGSPAWTDLMSVTATSGAGAVRIRYDVSSFNGSSGADRTADYRLICVTGGTTTDMGGHNGVSIPLAGTPLQHRYRQFSHTPGAGSHTWKVQGRGSAAASVVALDGALLVVEKGHRR